MIFLGIGFIILCLSLLRASSTDKTEIKSVILKMQQSCMEDAFQAGYESGFESAEGKIHVESCQQYVERKLKEFDNECKTI